MNGTYTLRKRTLLLISGLGLWSLGKGQGGLALTRTLKGYADHGWQIFMVIGDKNRDSTYDMHMDIHIIRFDVPWLKRWFKYRIVGFIAAAIWWLVFQITSFIIILRTIRKKRLKIDLVYGYEVMAMPVAGLLKKLLKVPMVSRFQGTIIYPWLCRPLWQLRKWDHLLAFKVPADLYIMTNDGTRGDCVLRTLGVDMNRVKFWMNGVDQMSDDRISIDQSKIRNSINIGMETRALLMLSRLVKWKRIDRALTALPHIINKHKNIVLVIIGDGEERRNLEEITNNLQIRDHVRFLGALPHDDIWPYLKIADIFLSLYDLSNVGNPLLEAMSCGKCIVTLNTGDTSTIIHNQENGILLELDKLPMLPDIICDLLSDDDLRKRLGQNAGQFAQNHFWTWEERMEKEISAVEKIMAGYGNT